MLKVMRKKGNIKAIMWLLAIIIIPAFVLWGGGSLLQDRNLNSAGKIFNKRVPLDEYLKSWEASRDQALMIYGRLFDQVAQYLDLDSQAWDRLILLEETKKENIKVSDKELAERIKDFPLFQKEEKFDPQAYDWILKYHFRTTPIRFEEQMRQSLAISKLVEKIYSRVKLSDAELKDEFTKEKEKGRFSYLMVEIQPLLNEINITDEKELPDYYAKNKESFRRPDSVKVEYISIGVKDVASGLSVSGEEIEEYFKSHSEEFTSIAPSPDVEEKDKPQAEKEAVETTAQPAAELTEKIGEDIKARLLSQKTKDKIEELKTEVSSQINPQTKFDEIAKKYGVSFKETDYFSLDSPLSEIGFNLGFYNAAFNLGIGEVSSPIETGQGYIFLKLKDKKNAYIPEFVEVKDKVGVVFKTEKARILTKEKTEKLIKRIGETSFEAAAKEFNILPVTTDLISRQSYIAGIGKSEEFMRIGFSLKPKEVSKEVVSTERGYVIARMDELTTVSEEDFQKEKDAFRETVLAKKQADYFQKWFEDLKKKANLQSNMDKLKSRVSP